MNKWLHEFNAKELIKKEDGSTEKIEKHFAILKPNRKMKEDAEIFYASETSRFAKAGVLPKAAWNTILSNGGGTISDNEREVYGSLLLKFRDLSFELQSILIKNPQDRTEKEKTRSDELIIELDEIRKEIQSFEASQIAIFENTAEAKARNRSILWWVLNLAYQKDNENYLPIFSGESFGDKLLRYDDFDDNEEKYEFILSVLRRITYLITLWFLGKADSKEDFIEFDRAFLNDNDDLSQQLETKKEPEVVKEPEIADQIEELKPE